MTLVHIDTLNALKDMTNRLLTPSPPQIEEPNETDDLVISFITGKLTPETDNIWIDVALTHSQAFELKYKPTKEEKTIEERVPKEYHNFLSVFNKKAASRFPDSRPWDHKIDLKEGFVPKSSKVYPLTPGEETSVKEFIDENLAKGYIRTPSLWILLCSKERWEEATLSRLSLYQRMDKEECVPVTPRIRPHGQT